MLDGEFDIKLIHQPQQGCNVIDLMDMGPQTDFGGQQILQHFVFGCKRDLLFFAAPGLAVLLVLPAHFKQPATQNGHCSHAGCRALAFPAVSRHGIITKSRF